MATTITIQTGGKPVKITAFNAVSDKAVESVYSITANTSHTFSLPDDWMLTMTDADAA